MPLWLIVLSSAAVLLVAYQVYGYRLVRLLQLDPQCTTPAYALRDDVDYAPLEPSSLMSQHFSAIAAAGPIVGPILAGVMFGWAPALIWILVGSILIGGVHDMTSLVASIRHKARSIAEVVREHMSPRAHVLFLLFVWLALVYIIVAFTDITAMAFIGTQTLENGEKVSGPGIATSSLLYLALPMLMGVLQRYAKLSLGWSTILALPLVAYAIWYGQQHPFDVASYWQLWYPEMSAVDAATLSRKTWDFALLAYCSVASLVPVWLLLQPRGQLGGWFLYIALFGGGMGLILSGENVSAPAFTSWTSRDGETLFPFLFITIACGACSGFHALIASGTTSKQLRNEVDARPIGYGTMLLEGLVAVVSLCCVMRLAPDSPQLVKPVPNLIYAEGIGLFVSKFGIPAPLAISFALMAFTTFVYDTLDICTRLGRFIIQELLGWHGWAGKLWGTLITTGVPMLLVTQSLTDAQGRPQPLWRVFWSLFGASNQLLAALSLLAVTVWLWKTRRQPWVFLVTGLPTLWMYGMSSWALGQMTWNLVTKIRTGDATNVQYILLGVSGLLLTLAAAMLFEAVIALLGPSTPTRPRSETPQAVVA